MFQPIPVGDFLARTELDPHRDLAFPLGSAEEVVSLRDLDSIDAVQLMPIHALEKILGHATLAGGNKARMYEGCRVRLMAISPKAARIGQRFIERKKYTALLEKFGSILKNFSIPAGPADLGAFIAIGSTKEGKRAIALYVPPVVEMNGTTAWTLLDGIHRNFVIERMGGTTPVIVIERVKNPLPFSLHEWDKIALVDEKPPIEERYFDLKPDYFRDLKYVGIDG
ncbi:MAG TPA: hypothetical protein VHC68_02165 [Candidatus Paceibacterota bacterium]|nr:hypothetical protein [Candidatus Paceibacterota bacterium]